jgi:uracil-DNA glycosylase
VDSPCFKEATVTDKYPGAEDFIPDSRDRDDLARAAADCRGCPLYQDAEHVVFGQGPTDARLILVGESPGQSEDAEGRPFVGRAGALLDEAIEAAGLSRAEVYITNAVKHIRWSSTNGRRTPKTPGVAHIQACRPWLEAEIEMVEPEYIVALGGRAARSVLGREVTISDSRAQMHDSLWKIPAIVAYHPAAALRHPVREQREQIFQWIVQDLRFAGRPRPTGGGKERPRVR